MDALKVGNLDDAVKAADEMMYLLALHRIINPLVEIDMAGKLVSLQIKVIRLRQKTSNTNYSICFQILFEKNTRNSQMKVKLWVQGTLRYNLRSFQLGFRMMSISSGLARQVLMFPLKSSIINVNLSGITRSVYSPCV